MTCVADNMHLQIQVHYFIISRRHMTMPLLQIVLGMPNKPTL